ncbi:MAG TPA: CBS domain-containing protein [Acetobacteraceae bacterium]|jgi:CBS-domain-containing membrane protein|nr:CBS domain-containing protein [Acetobacteraceae bacterium]
MNVADVMTRHVISVPPDATVEAAARLMLERGISGLMVVDAKGELAGVVTEGDLLRRDELGTVRHRPWWLRMLLSPGRQAADFTRAHGRRVRDVMTQDVVTVSADAPLEDVVESMERHRIKRVPVTEGNRIIGVVSRSDLMRALVVAERHDRPVATDDRSIRLAILDALDKQSWTPLTTLNVTVADRVVDLWGTITNDEERRAICVLAENTPGVQQVNDHMVFVEPYSGTVVGGPAEQ